MRAIVGRVGDDLRTVAEDVYTGRSTGPLQVDRCHTFDLGTGGAERDRRGGAAAHRYTLRGGAGRASVVLDGE